MENQKNESAGSHEKNESSYSNKPQLPVESPNETFESDSTTGSGFSQAERNVQDGTNSDASELQNNGSQDLVDQYNINDQAHADSSKKDFVKTTSTFHHAEEDEKENPNTNSPGTL